MSRWRPPQPKSSPYITPEGYITLEQEVKTLWAKRKKEQAGLDRRIRYLQKRMPDLKVIDQIGNQEQVFFSATVTLEKDNGDQVTHRIVGPDETDAKRSFISIDSPLAKALLKKSVGDEVTIIIDAEPRNYLVVEIRY